MKAKLIKIGKSRGVRIPEGFIKRAGLERDVVITVEDDAVVIRRKNKVRAGCAESCRLMHERGDDALIDGPLPSLTTFDEERWEW